MLPCELNKRWTQITTILGAFLVFFPTGVVMYWGNLSVYVNSYFYNNTGNDQDTQSPWVISFFSCWWSLGIFVSSLMVTIIPRQILMLTGIALYSLGNILGYLAISHSLLLWFDLSFVIMGLGNGFSFTLNFIYINEWSGDHVGFVTAFVLGAFQVGAVFITAFVTVYINPLNESAEFNVGATRYFTQPSILQNVPSTFLILTVGAIVCQFTGFCLLRSKEQITKKKESNEIKAPLLDDEVSPCISRNDIAHDSNSSVYEALNDNESKKRNSTIKLIRALLASRVFYVLFFVLGCSFSSFISFFNNFKAFGNVYISDDYFLSNLATIMSLISIGVRLLWGLLADKIGVKRCLILYTALMTVLSSTYSFTPIPSKWLYFTSTLLFAASHSGFYTLISLSVLRVFEKDWYSVAYGLLLFSEVLATVIMPFSQNGLLLGAGWLGVFGAQGFFMGVSMVVTVIWFPNT